MTRIYILEDDESISGLLEYALSSSGFDVSTFPRPSAFWDGMEKNIPDLVLLDIMLPEESGLDVLKKIRRSHKWKDLAVIMLTAASSEFDKVTGLDLGADDYITKPFGMMELLSRIKAVLRRRGQNVDEERTITYGPVSLDRRAHSVFLDGKELNLSLKEYELLSLLMENEGACLSREQILTSVWGYSSDSESRTVDVHIRHIREKLKDSSVMIETVTGVGYRFNGKVFGNEVKS